MLASLANNDVYRADRALLDGPHWLNDAVVGFCMAYFQRRTFHDVASVRLVGPGTAFVVAHEDDEDDLRDTLRGMGLDERQLLLLPVNNNEDVASTGGSHWSLLARLPDGRYRAYDSMRRANERHARRLAAKLHAALSSGGDDDSKLDFETADEAPQQTNSYDCGVFALLVARTLAQLHADGVDLCSDRAREALENIKPDHVRNFRAEIGAFIDEVGRKCKK